MKNDITVGELKKALEGVDDNCKLDLVSDTGVDQHGDIVEITDAYYSQYRDVFCIYANARDIEKGEWEESEE